jgi:hypothetical protein
MESWPLRLSLANSTLSVYPKVGFLCFPLIKVEARAQALLAALPEAEVLMGLPGVGPQVGGGAGPPAPAPLGKGQGGGRLRGADPRAGGVGHPGRGLPFCEGSFSTITSSRGGSATSRPWWPWPTSFALGPLPQMNRRRMMGRLREYYAGQSLQGVA